jgi:hypothetical protein
MDNTVNQVAPKKEIPQTSVEATGQPVELQPEKSSPVPIEKVPQQASSAAAGPPSKSPQHSTALANSAQAAANLHTSSTQARALTQVSTLHAEDVDLIEKPWVEATEHVIEETKDDPSIEDQAQQQISKQYLKKRFNVDIK